MSGRVVAGDGRATVTPSHGSGALDRRARRVLVAQLHEAAALLLAAAALWSAGVQLAAIDGWGLWAAPLFVAAVVAGGRGATVWIGPALPLRWRRAAVWAALAIATPTALATMTTIDFSALAACQLLLVAAWLAELSTKARVVAFMWIVPAATVAGLLLYRTTL